ncbi:carotenoid oxygenase family protein [Paenibacillus hamazuiensis]|uniref:carotenoid oxygenase family protein n=1 Tax=Paenibacillus hamazuiensis TaxID=2936508 RepID=UPI00200C3A6E|nr:carotenoid oxygenase family protein [Paenibacillus hamazuiensis]
MKPFQMGLTTLEQEVNLEALPVRGRIPSWLSGALFRNGPAHFQGGHWFDGLAMIHKFSFKAGVVSYANRFLRTEAYRRVMSGSGSSGFGTGGARGGNNANVSILKIDHHFLALTESPGVVEFDPADLSTKGLFPFDDEIPAHMTTAHPHLDIHTGQIINFTVQFGKTNQYHVYTMDPVTAKRRLIGSVETHEPTYMHSFAVTQRYVILVEFPLLIQAAMLAGGHSFADSLAWKAERGTRLVVMNKATGNVERIVQGEAGFGYHVINAFEKGSDIIVDVCMSGSAAAITNLYIDQMTSEAEGQSHPKFKRFILSPGQPDARCEVLSPETMELPSIYYKQCNGRDYRYAYGISTSSARPENVSNQLIKIDTATGQAWIWHEEDNYPGEPVFVPTPGAIEEDGGVLLSVVLDGLQGKSYLLVLDAKNLEEIGRAEVPHHIPFGFHGIYTDERMI